MSPTTWPVQDWLTATQSVGHCVACIPSDNDHVLSVASVTPVACLFLPLPFPLHPLPVTPVACQFLPLPSPLHPPPVPPVTCQFLPLPSPLHPCCVPLVSTRKEARWSVRFFSLFTVDDEGYVQQTNKQNWTLTSNEDEKPFVATLYIYKPKNVREKETTRMFLNG